MDSQQPSRPLAIYLLSLVLAFLSLAALGGGYLLVSDPTGGVMGLPSAWVSGSPSAPMHPQRLLTDPPLRFL